MGARSPTITNDHIKYDLCKRLIATATQLTNQGYGNIRFTCNPSELKRIKEINNNERNNF